MKKTLIFILTLFLLVGIANALTVSPNPVSITGNVSTTANGNFSISTTTNVTGITFVKTDLVGSIVNISSSYLTFNQSTPFNMLNGTTTNVIASVAIPASAYAGTYNGQVNVTDGAGNSSLLNVSLTVQSIVGLSVNSTASITSEADVTRTALFYVRNIGSINLTNINVSGADIQDNDNDTIALSYSPNNFALAPGAQQVVTVSANIHSKVDTDTYTRIINVTDLIIGVNGASTLTIKVLPADVVCSDGEKGNLVLSVDNPDPSDEFKPGELINLEVNVDNAGDEDISAYVQAFLYDKDKNKKIASVKSDKTKINNGDDKDFDLSLKVPVDADEDNDRYVLYIKAYESGNEDDQCDQSDVDIDIIKEDDMVLVEKLKAEPSTVSCGGSTTVNVGLFNTGSNNEEDVRVRLKETTLQLDQYSNFFDLDEGDDITKTFTVTIPKNVSEIMYFMEVTVYDGNGDKFDSGSANVTVSGGCKAITTTTPSEKITLSLFEKTFTTTGKLFNIPIKITNTGDDAEFSIELSNIDEWATSTSKTVFLSKDQSTTIYLPLQTKSGIEQGNYSATVNVKSDGKTIKTDSIIVDVKGGGGISFGALKGISTNNLFWIIGDIALIIVAILFIRFIFMPKK